MDSTIVQEIANQLGIAVDQIMEWLPAYANARWLSYFIPFVIITCLLVISVVATIIFKLKYIKWDNNYNNIYIFLNMNDMSDEERMNKHMSRSKADQLRTFYDIAFDIGIMVGLICLFAFIMFLIFGLGPLIGWATAPEMTFLKSLV